MSKKELQIIINAKDNASKSINGVSKALKGFTSFAKTASIAIGAATGGLAAVVKVTTDATNELNNALLGLSSVANAFNQDVNKAKQAAMELANDGLMSVKDAANSLKNLLATGFSLDEAINLMYAFKDAAAFNRQGTLEFGQAIEGATQGIKNQNSILVDNAGITKNLSIILKEAGFSVQDLSKVTSDATVRQALYNGILKEASIFQGDAARLSGTLSGKQAALATQIFNVKAAIGEALLPVMELIIGRINEAIIAVGGPEGIKAKFMEYQDEILMVTNAVLWLIKAIGTLIKWFVQLSEKLGDVIYKLSQAIKKMKELKDMAANKVSGFVDSVKDTFSFGGGKAIGGPVNAGTSYLVGEKGPELFTPNASGSIIPNHALAGGGISISITGNTLLDSRAGERIGDMIIKKLSLSNKL